MTLTIRIYSHNISQYSYYHPSMALNNGKTMQDRGKAYRLQIEKNPPVIQMNSG